LSGSTDRDEDKSFIVKEAHFNHPDIDEINNKCIGTRTRDIQITKKIDKLKNSF